MMAIHKSCRVDVAYIDSFSKAFDSVCHSKWIPRLESFSICGKLLSWIKDYISNRHQRVKVGDSFSSLSSVCSGVPKKVFRSSCISYLYKINDIVDEFGDFLTVKLFADDVKVYVVIDNDVKVQILQEGLNKLKNWSDSWQLDLSLHKCATLHIGNDTKNSYNGCHLYVLVVCTAAD